MSPGRLAGCRVLVVGAGTRPSGDPDPPLGNGRAISILAAREGAEVICADRDEVAARHTAALAERESGRASVVVADAADEASCRSMIESAGEIDGLVVNIGSAPDAAWTRRPCATGTL